MERRDRHLRQGVDRRRNEAVGDRANDALRVDGSTLRCRMVGEGGNLGFTQLGRVEYALAGGLIYTDAIDNSAGVDCSDHEVNIKIALDHLVARRRADGRGAQQSCWDMTDEVAELVLDHNRDQTLALTIARHQSLPMVNVHARYLDQLEAEGLIDRALEYLPTDKQIAERQSLGSRAQRPRVRRDDRLHEELRHRRDPRHRSARRSGRSKPTCSNYFPSALRHRFPDALRRHRLRREIIATTLVNSMVNLAGISFDHRMTEDTGQLGRRRRPGVPRGAQHRRLRGALGRDRRDR